MLTRNIFFVLHVIGQIGGVIVILTNHSKRTWVGRTLGVVFCLSISFVFLYV